MGKKTCVKFNKVEDYWTLADIYRIQQDMQRTTCAEMSEADFEDVESVGYGYAFLTLEQIKELEGKNFLLVDMHKNIL